MKRVGNVVGGSIVALLFASHGWAQSFGGPPYYNGTLGVGTYDFGGNFNGDVNLGGNFDRNNNVGVLDRPHPDYAPLGIRVGQFGFYPSIIAGVRYDSNIYAENTQEQSDEIADVKAHFEADSNFAVNTLNFYSDVRRQQYLDHPEESATTYDLGAKGKFTVTRDAYFDGGAGFNHDIEARSSLTGNLNSREPIRYDDTSAHGQFTQEFDRLQLRVGVNYDYYNYQNDETAAGTEVFETYRNHSYINAHAEADYAISPNTAAYITGHFIDEIYNLKPPTVPDNRDSTGEEVDGGVDVDLTQLIRGRVEVGYYSEDFKDGGTVSGPTFHAKLQYFVTPLTTVTLAGGRNFYDSGIAQAPAFLDTTINLRADHELLRNVILTGQVGYETAQYESYSRTDDRFSVYAGGTYLLNRRMGIRVLYNFLQQTSSGANRALNFDDNTVTAALVLSY